jgi:hypothetical protein
MDPPITMVSNATIVKPQNRIAILKQSLPESLRDPSYTLWEAHAQELYTDAYTGRAYYARRLIEWIPEFERRLKREPGKVVEELDQIRAQGKLPRHRSFCHTQYLLSTSTFGTTGLGDG